jgi:hypothetical protein
MLCYCRNRPRFKHKRRQLRLQLAAFFNKSNVSNCIFPLESRTGSYGALQPEMKYSLSSAISIECRDLEIT